MSHKLLNKLKNQKLNKLKNLKLNKLKNLKLLNKMMSPKLLSNLNKNNYKIFNNKRLHCHKYKKRKK